MLWTISQLDASARRCRLFSTRTLFSRTLLELLESYQKLPSRSPKPSLQRHVMRFGSQRDHFHQREINCVKTTNAHAWFVVRKFENFIFSKNMNFFDLLKLHKFSKVRKYEFHCEFQAKSHWLSAELSRKPMGRSEFGIKQFIRSASDGSSSKMLSVRSETGRPDWHHDRALI